MLTIRFSCGFSFNLFFIEEGTWVLSNSLFKNASVDWYMNQSYFVLVLTLVPFLLLLICF